MKILLDECIDRRFARDLTGHEVQTVPQMMGGHKERRTSHARSGIIRCFRDGRSQSFVSTNLSRYDIAVVVLRCRTNRLRDLQAFVPELLTSLPLAKHRDVLRLETAK